MRGEIKREIIRLIDENGNPWVKAAFYSNPEVTIILERLINAWESNDGKGIPLDYANDVELETLYEMAKRYSSMSEEEARSYIWGGEESSKGERGSLMDLLRRILRRTEDT